MVDHDLELIEQLLSAGFEAGKSKGGRLLRVDNRNSAALLPNDLFAMVLQTTTVREIYLRGSTGMLNEQINALTALPRLQVLDVENSDLNDASLRQLASMATLQVLNVRGTGVTTGQIAITRKSMIGTRIIG